MRTKRFTIHIVSFGSAAIRDRDKGCLDWDSIATFLRLFSDADAQVRKRRDSFASTQVIELCWVRRVDWATQTRLSEA